MVRLIGKNKSVLKTAGSVSAGNKSVNDLLVLLQGLATAGSITGIYNMKELYNDVGVILSDYTLGKWSEQGVLLLNCAMTVREGEPGSHLDVWENFTNGAIKKISENCNNIVFMLWGKYAQKKQCIISSDKNHLILKSNHPSPLSANRGGWFGCKHFSKANEYLSKNNKTEIKW